MWRNALSTLQRSKPTLKSETCNLPKPSTPHPMQWLIKFISIFSFYNFDLLFTKKPYGLNEIHQNQNVWNKPLEFTSKFHNGTCWKLMLAKIINQVSNLRWLMMLQDHLYIWRRNFPILKLNDFCGKLSTFWNFFQ